MPGRRTIAKLIQREKCKNTPNSAPTIPKASEILQPEMIEHPHYHCPWDNCKPAPANGMIPDGFGHDKFTYALDRKNPVLPYIAPPTSVKAFTVTSSNLLLAEYDTSKKAPSKVKPIQKETKGPMGDVVTYLSGFANHFCPCYMSYYCTKPHHSPAWTFEVYPVSAPKPTETPCGSDCYRIPGPCRTYALDGDEVQAATLKTILKTCLTEGPLCKLHKCERPQCDGVDNCDRATCCQLAEMIERPCRAVAWVIQELINATPKNCKPVRPRIPPGLVPSIRLPYSRDPRTGRSHYKGCYHPSYACNQPKANCRCHKYNTGCYALCCCSLDCRLRNMCQCADDCAGNSPQCSCAELVHMCVKCNVFADFGHVKLTKSGRSSVAGMGTFIMVDAKAGAFIDEYTGQLMTDKHNDLRLRQPDYPVYSFEISEGFAVDACRFGNKMRFINHSEHNKNTFFKVVRVNGEHKIGVFAERDLKAGEELFLMYEERFDRKKKNGTGKNKKTPSDMQIAIAEFIDVPLSPGERVPQESELVHASPLPKNRDVYGRDVVKVTGVICGDDVLTPEEKEQLIWQLKTIFHPLL